MTDAVRAELTALLPRLRRFAYGLAGSVDEGDDLVQQACERALTRLHQWQPGTRLDSWMFRIVQTCWIDRHRKRSRGREVAMDAEDVDRAGGGHPGREPEARLELSAAERAIAALPEDQRAVLLLTAVDGCSYRDAADTLDIPIGTVMSRLSRARTALARALDGPQDGSLRGDAAAPTGRRTSPP